MTKASVGSHAPKTSRKPRTRAGLVIPERVRPAPNNVPETSGGRSFLTSDMSPSDHRLDEHRYDTGRDERQGCDRSEEHTSELQSLMRISYAVFFLKKKKDTTQHET